MSAGMDLVGTRWREIRTGCLVEIVAYESTDDTGEPSRAVVRYPHTGKVRRIPACDLLRRYMKAGI